MFWFLMFGSACLASAFVFNPFPVIGCLILWVITKPKTEELRAEIRAAGMNPETPPLPVDGTSAATCAVWILVMGGAATLFLGLLVLAIEGRL